MKKASDKNRRSSDRTVIRKEYQKSSGKKWRKHGSWQEQLQINT